MIPKTNSEKLMFNTVRLETHSGSGTGFFHNFLVDGKIVPVIITNKHVINDNPKERVTFYLHLGTNEEGSDENFQITLDTDWIFHPTYDLCCCPINPVFEGVKKETGKNVIYASSDDSLIASSSQLEELSAIEELVMVGYPIGLWDSKNNFPIFRKGYTANHPAIDFNDKGIGLADIACFPGSSGSPIYILNETIYSDKSGNVYPGDRMMLIGILYAGPVYNAEGNLIVSAIPTQQSIMISTPAMTNLGYYIKAEALRDLEDQINHILQNENLI